jgi:hypothetical protein
MATDNEIQTELEEISPVLSRLLKTNPYTVPPGYFEQLPSTILAEVKQVKVMTMTPVSSARRFALAAAVMGLIFIGGWLYMQKQPATSPLNKVSMQKDMQQMSETEMANYIDVNDILSGDAVSSSGQISGEDMALVLADVPDQELKQYLEQENSSLKLN